ncbi:MAG: hypothetical protein ACE5JL_18845 [Dehalococcoidia bacterium]
MEEEPQQTKKAPVVEQAEQSRCDICGAPTDLIHCKDICPNCGYTRDCSDP